MNTLSLVAVLAVCSACLYLAGGEVTNSVSHSNGTNETRSDEQFLITNCMMCHPRTQIALSPTGPNIASVVKTYANRYRDRDSFAHAIKAFVLKPSRQTALMKHTIDHYGLMPSLPVNGNDLFSAAQFLFDKHRDSPEWLDSSPQQTPTDSILLQTRSMAGRAQGELARNLMAALEVSTLHAVDFCSLRATAIGDSMNKVLGFSLRRVSDRPRNPANSATPAELDALERIKATKAKTGEYKAILDSADGSITAYFPIAINPMCLQCHGKPVSDIDASVLSLLKSRYPDDKATGYSNGELRGMWRVIR